MQDLDAVSLFQWFYAGIVVTLCVMVVREWIICWRDFIKFERFYDANEETTGQKGPHEAHAQRHAITVTARPSESPAGTAEHPPSGPAGRHQNDSAA